jgi:murein DD-endopeptidase MepM/ murein hydrolase activator NlpD
MRRSLALLAACASALSFACDEVEEIRDTFRGETQRETYEHSLRDAGLMETALGRDWLAAGERSIEQALAVATPFEETGWLAPEEAAAVGYRLSARRGQRVTISAAIEPDSAAMIFIDVFQAARDSTEEPRRIASADSAGRTVEFEPRRDGDFIVRVQPELLRGGRYTITIRSGASLSFPVLDASSRNIQSVFGDPRDAGARRHHGVDIFAKRGTPALAAAEGRISRVRVTAIGGKVVWLRDSKNNANLYYAHLDSQTVSAGDIVQPGDTVGFVGNTGNARTTPPHLHFGIYQRGEGPVDPYWFVYEPRGNPERLTADTSRLGRWTRSAGDRLTLRASPTDRAEAIDELPRHTALRVDAAIGAWYRVRLPDGRAGFVSARLTESAAKPLRTQRVAAGSEVLASPAPTAVSVERLAAGDPVEVLARFGGYLYVEAPNGRMGWLAID